MQNLQRIEKLSQSAIKSYKKNKIKEARKSVSKLLSSKPPSAYHLFQTGIAAYNATDLEAALKLHNKALDFSKGTSSTEADIIMSRGLIHMANNDLETACDDFTKAHEIDPKNARVLNNRSLALSKLRKDAEALADLEKANALDPTNLNAVLNLLRLLVKLKNTEKALQYVQSCMPIHGENADFLVLAGNIKSEQNPLEALTLIRKAAHKEPNSSFILNSYSDVFVRLGNLRNFEGLDKDLLLLLSNETVEWKKLNWIVPQHLKSLPDFQQILPLLEQAVSQNKDVNLDFGQVVKCMTNPVLLASLKRIRLSDPLLEKLLETFRRQTLAALASDIQLEDALKQVLLSILLPFAKYSFMAEYVFSESDFEKQTIPKVVEKIKNSPAFSIGNALNFVIICSYKTPYKDVDLTDCAKNWGNTKIDALNEFIDITINEPLAERALIPTISQLTKIEDSISLSVREQYEENPYPRWEHFPNRGGTKFPLHIATLLPSLKGNVPSMPEHPEILIAGCGTGQQPISTSFAFPDANVTAVDLSLASIAYAKRKTNELGIKNLSFGQADIMELRSLDRKFNVVECAGVLHHMHDPIAGWKVLVDLLEDDGFMLIALYSEIGRRDIVAAREFIEKQGYGNDANNIRACRKHLLSLPDSEIAKAVCRHSDFYTMSACRDLIFHVQEHRFTIPQIEKALDTLGLEFLGFQNTHKHQDEAYTRNYPDDVFKTNLDHWNQFEQDNPDIFSAMYKFWVRKRKS
ncbi:methyltransferase domain-containing protein [Sneathiella sp. P13V-1]|uniref:class I SAM-dependent methyltransferase n=1 Tax=Sneathiella sp. P13V-1 TaxID=2697366 RepID=UPI00187B2146|nr:class I SAM-dependent methyltransferase [Sneathiella sp. P13V-1]MBE7635214.1 methyltransferase domain-containing protein [Sneathiella sp. P13V-1]